MHPLATLALLGAAQGLILAIAILPLHHGHRIANRVLAVFLIIQAARLFALAYDYAPSDSQHIWVYQFLHLSYGYGPLLYFYVRLLVDNDYRLRWASLLHFLPMLLAIILLWPGGWLIDADPALYRNFATLPPEQQRMASLATVPVYALLFTYSLIAWRHLQRHRRRIREEFSALEMINLNWLRVLVGFCLLAAAINAPVELLRAFTDWNLGPRVAASTALSVLMICYIGVMGLRQPAIFDQGRRQAVAPGSAAAQPHADTGDRPPAESPEKYEKSALDEAHVERIWQRVEQCMRDERLYLQPGIKLAELAERVSTLPNYLSQTINRRAGKNFFEYINGYRLQEACRMLAANPDRSVGEIALDAGFNSQNVFNGHFKKATGQTPTQYRKNLKTAEKSV